MMSCSPATVMCLMTSSVNRNPRSHLRRGCAASLEACLQKHSSLDKRTVNEVFNRVCV